jgi:hypothetical protein
MKRNVLNRGSKKQFGLLNKNTKICYSDINLNVAKNLESYNRINSNKFLKSSIKNFLQPYSKKSFCDKNYSDRMNLGNLDKAEDFNIIKKKETTENYKIANNESLQEIDNPKQDKNSASISPSPGDKNSELTPENLLTKAKVEQMNKILPLGENIVKDAIKYKIFENSSPAAIEKLQTEVPEIKGHLEFQQWVKSIIDQDKQEEIFKSQGILILKSRQDIFHKFNVDLNNYRKFHDREYEVDIEEVLTKDLFEKQRVVDSFVEENKENINNLIGYYNNRFKHLKYNKFNYLIYQNNYLDQMKWIKLKFVSNIAAVSALSGVLYLFNPYLLFFLIPEYLAIVVYCHLLNNLVDQVILCENKHNIILRTFNFLGFRKEYRRNSHQILQISYYEKFYNRILNLSDKGWFLTTRLIRRIFKKDKKRAKSDKIVDKNLDDFKSFHMIRSNFKFFYIPADLTKQHPDTNEELILNILNRNQKFVEEYDYSTYEDRVGKLKDALEEYKKELAKKSHGMFVTEKERLQAEYSNIAGNRDFADDHLEMTYKRRDGVDGTYINNGYR